MHSSNLTDAAVFGEALPGNWSAALRQLAGILPDDQPSVVVLDEVPYLMDDAGTFESVLQRAWDRELSRKPVLLILIGSDLTMMEALTSYGRPFRRLLPSAATGPAATTSRSTSSAPTDRRSPSSCTSSDPSSGTRTRRSTIMTSQSFSDSGRGSVPSRYR